MKFITRFAASILLACGLFAVLFISLHSSLALADVVRKASEAKSVSFVVRMIIPGVKNPSKMKMIADNAGHFRVEEPGGIVMTMDSAAGKSLMIEPKTRTATIMSFDPTGRDQVGGVFIDPIAELKRMKDKSSKELGEKDMNGKKAKGFVVQDGWHEVTIWADAKTGEPVQMEMDLADSNDERKVIISDFVFNVAVNAEMFSINPPAGYQLQQVKLPNVGKDGEKNVIEALKGFAERSGGRFPAHLNEWTEFTALAKTDPKNPAKLDDASMQWMTSVGGMTPFLTMLPKDGQAYLGDGVRLNQKDTMIFWYRTPEGKYRAIYADLTVKDVEGKDLPKAPAPLVAPRTPVQTK